VAPDNPGVPARGAVFTPTSISLPMNPSASWSRFARLALAALLLPLLAAAADPIPLDPLVRTGVLPNGLTYYIRKNVKPEKRVELRLAVNTGSVQEDDDQLGLAHLVEHMCFKGTKSFPKADLIHYLQSVGATFGPDINAYTAFDETVYMLSLPTDVPDTLQNGLKIMREWAHDVTFDPADIDTERGVVVEEWRLGRGASQRMLDKFLPVIFKDSKYAQRLPIGTKESIEGMSHDTIKRFYHDWYRPDLMAMIVVGDIDPDQMEQTIRTEFGSIPASAQPRPKEAFAIPDNDAPLFSIVSDRENPYNILILAFKTAVPKYETTDDFRRHLTEELFLQLLNLRLAELMQQANPPFIYTNASYGHLWVRAKGAYQLTVVVPDGGVDRGLATVLTENERVRQHGFTANELTRAKKSMLRSLEQRYLDREKTESPKLVGEFVAHYLAQEPAPGITYEYEFAKAHLDGITLDEVNRLPQQWITPKNRVVVVENVEKPAVKLPAEAELQAVFSQVAATKVEPYQEKQLAASLLATKPAPGRIVAQKTIDAIGVTELTFANGVRVVLKPSQFKNDEVVFTAYRPGGQFLFGDDYNLAAQLAAPCAMESGVGSFSKPDLQKMLAGKTVFVQPQLSPYYDGLRGNSSAGDLETALQLTWLYFTAPRADETVYSSLVSRQQAALKNVLSNPLYSFFNETRKIRYDHNPRTPGLLPTDEDWAKVSFAKTTEVYRTRFANAAGFTFVFAGSFTVESITPLLQTYLGSLPSTGVAGTWKDLGVRSIPGPFEQTLLRGTDPKSFVLISFEGPAARTLEDGHTLWSMGNILQRALIDKLRLELGGVYAVNVNILSEKAPYDHYAFDLVIPCAPDNVEKLVAATYGEINRIRQDGVKPEEIQKEVESQRRTAEKDEKDNGAWSWKLEMIYRENEPFTRLSNPEGLIALVTAENVQRVAVKFVDPSKAVRFTMLPEKK
jgi:zinc protease